MQSHTAGGELLVEAGVDSTISPPSVRRTLRLRGHEEPIEALVLTA